jgi:hypothetical protein
LPAYLDQSELPFADPAGIPPSEPMPEPLAGGLDALGEYGSVGVAAG